jgi:hypothetical protein
MKLLRTCLLVSVCAALTAPVLAQTTINVPAQRVTVFAPAQTVAMPASSTKSASTYTVPAYHFQYTVPAYTLTVAGNTPPPAAAATVTLQAAPASIKAGAASTLTWASSNATSCKGVGTVLSGAAAVSPTVTTSYTQTCTGAGGSATASATVTVTAVTSPPPPPPPTPPPSSPPPPTAGNCNQQLGATPVAFCETFAAPAGLAGTRTGDLNPSVWGVSRTIGDSGVNFGQGDFNRWNATVIDKCDGTAPTVNAPADVIICNGQLREAVNDNNTLEFENGDVAALGMYAKQSFDFAGRTGTVSLDVSNDSTGIHSVWPEIWMSDLPVPVPFTHFSSWVTLPANGFGVRFANVAPPGMQGECPNANNVSVYRWTVDSAIVSRGYVEEDTNGYGVSTGLKVNILDCVISSSGPGNMNHVELRISQNQIDVYATDAGVAPTVASLRHIASITGANLTFTRGLVWLEDAHYNADKQTTMNGQPPSASQRQHTFSWANIAFDGPFTDRDFTFDAPDNTAPGANGSFNLGKFSAANATSTWSVAGLPANIQAAGAKVVFSFNGESNPNPTTLTVIVNGHALSVPWPYPDQLTNTWRTFAVAIPLTDLVTGVNTVQLGANAAELFSNVDIVLADVPGGVPVLPGSNDSYPGTSQ